MNKRRKLGRESVVRKFLLYINGDFINIQESKWNLVAHAACLQVGHNAQEWVFRLEHLRYAVSRDNQHAHDVAVASKEAQQVNRRDIRPVQVIYEKDEWMF